MNAMMPVYVLRTKAHKVKERNGGKETWSVLSFKERAAEKLMELRVANAVEVEYIEVRDESLLERIVGKLLSF